MWEFQTLLSSSALIGPAWAQTDSQSCRSHSAEWLMCLCLYCLLWFVMLIRQRLTKISVRLKCCSIKIAASCVDNVRLFCLTPAEEKKNTLKKQCCWLPHCCSWLQCRVLLIINVKLSLTFKHTGNKTSLLEEFLPWCKQRVDSAEALQLQTPCREAHQQGATLDHELN